jgi:hypothetical protein
MKTLVVVLGLLLLATPLLAKEIELLNTPGGMTGSDYILSGSNWSMPTPLMPGEAELSHDLGWAYYHWGGGIAGFASLFTAPYDLHVVKVKLLCYNSSGRNYYIDVLAENDSTGQPDRYNSLIGGYETFWQGAVGGDTWIEFTLSNPAYIGSGTHFFPMSDDNIEGLDNAPQDNQGPGPAGSAWWYFGDNSWYDETYFGAMCIRVIVNDDVAGPYADQLDPAPGATVPPNTDISLHIKDDDIGVDSSTITADSVAITVGGSPVAGTLNVDDSNINDVLVTFYPDADFNEGDTVVVTLSPSGFEIKDLLTNVMEEDSYEFYIGPYANIQPTSLGVIKASYK